ncbi:hypothetical protein [Candidatus Villigracilis affinis]|uniref:hypothetical protein n=1 Tax=Candidatus Villigracilis affinis TaxID=3140682 RepID=UPI002A200C73|nr:hypothetical protein [Anaerolineales bacterium]
MIPNKKPSSSENKSISISGDVKDSNVFIGDNNTFIKKIFNIFKNVLDVSLHGAAFPTKG